MSEKTKLNSFQELMDKDEERLLKLKLKKPTGNAKRNYFSAKKMKGC